MSKKQKRIVPDHIIETTHGHLRNKGGQQNEGVVLWLGAPSPIKITGAIIPRQITGGGYFKIPLAERQKIVRQLAGSKHKVVAQVHSHPHEAFHSVVDDREAIPRQVGALSLVVPNYASRQSMFDGSVLYQLQANGLWAEISIEGAFGVQNVSKLRKGIEWLIAIPKRLAR